MRAFIRVLAILAACNLPLLAEVRVAGDWVGRMVVRGVSRAILFSVEVKGTKVGGKFTSNGDTASLFGCKITGPEVTCSMDGVSDTGPFVFHGIVDGDSMKFEMSTTLNQTGEVVSVGKADLLRKE